MRNTNNNNNIWINTLLLSATSQAPAQINLSCTEMRLIISFFYIFYASPFSMPYFLFCIFFLKKNFFLLFLLPSSSFRRLQASTNARDENIFNDKIQIKNNKLKLKHRGTSLCSFSYWIKQKKINFLNKVFASFREIRWK